MNLPRFHVVTLGVTNLERSTRFYEAVFGISANTENEEISFFELPGTWLSLFPLKNLAEDISDDIPKTRSGFSGVTVAHMADKREDVLAIFKHAEAAGAAIVKPPGDTFWGGFSGYFADPDGYFWEVVWGPMFEKTPDGSLQFQKE